MFNIIVGIITIFGFLLQILDYFGLKPSKQIGNSNKTIENNGQENSQNKKEETFVKQFFRLVFKIILFLVWLFAFDYYGWYLKKFGLRVGINTTKGVLMFASTIIIIIGLCCCMYYEIRFQIPKNKTCKGRKQKIKTFISYVMVNGVIIAVICYITMLLPIHKESYQYYYDY